MSDKGFFNNKGYLSRKELRWKLEQDSGKIPGLDKWYSDKERREIENIVFSKNYGNYITIQEFKQGIRRLKTKKSKTAKMEEKIKLERMVRYLSKFLE